jgi:hyperosmotically inducible protein
MLQRCTTLLSAVAMVVAIGCAQSDPGITTAVKSKLAADDTVKAYQIDVDTRDRVVTLSGTVETPAAKEQAVLIARQTDGVRDVVDQITVNRETAATAGDLDNAAERAGREAREEIREGTEATKEAARDTKAAAGRAADRTGAAVSDAAITSAVKSKFLVDSAVSGLKIDVDTSNGMVTLNGNVTSKAEADRAMTLARNTDGVKSVHSNLKIGG